MDYPWPGNVRELRNTIEYAFVLCQAGEIGLQHLPSKIVHVNVDPKIVCELDPACTNDRDQLIEVLRKTDGNQSKAAKILGVSRVTVWKRIKKFGIELKKEVA